MTQLDGLRCFAAFSVVVWHYSHDLPAIKFALPWAGGVRLFFVLSAFLITQILLRERDAVLANGGRAWDAIRPFYGRRVIRIFPLYYLVLGVTAILAVHPVREGLSWHLAYATNFYLVRAGNWSHTISHLWTLALEEQFYLLWPWVVLLAPRASLSRIAIALATLAPLYRATGWLAGWNEVVIEAMPIASLDSLGLGALLAILSHDSPEAARKLVRWSFWIGLSLSVPALAARALGYHIPVVGISMATILSLLAVWLIDGASRGFQGVLGWVLERRPIVYLGRISYGIYIWHLFGYALVEYFLWAWPIGLTRRELHDSTTPVHVGPAVILAMTLVTVGMAAVCWHAFERPLLGLKRMFPYPEAAGSASSALQARRSRQPALPVV